MIRQLTEHEQQVDKQYEDQIVRYSLIDIFMLSYKKILF